VAAVEAQAGDLAERLDAAHADRRRAEAEVARLIAARDMQRESARFHAERAGRLVALVEAGLALADEWEREAAAGSHGDGHLFLVQTHGRLARCLRDTLGGVS
jgi:hypothetical protein